MTSGPSRRRDWARRLGRRIERPPAHWGLLALLLLGLMLVLFAQGVAEHLTGASGTPTASGDPVLRRGETFLYSGQGGLQPRGPAPGRRIALTFDDGPDPKWTPRIASTLRVLHVPATFFVVGDRVAHYPGIVDGLADDGFEIGNHTFTHSDLTGLSG